MKHLVVNQIKTLPFQQCVEGSPKRGQIIARHGQRFPVQNGLAYGSQRDWRKSGGVRHEARINPEPPKTLDSILVCRLCLQRQKGDAVSFGQSA